MLRIARAAPVVSRALFASARCFSASGKLSSILASEAKHEGDQYESPPLVKDFLDKSDFTFKQTEGDVNMTLTRTLGDKTVTIDWQLTSPFGDMAEMEGEEDMQTPADFTIAVESQGKGLVFYCSTTAEQGARYTIGNVRCYAGAEEKESPTAYNGPDFEDLDEKLQEAFDNYLEEIGMTESVCDFIEATALDKEQVEYMRWLNATNSFIQ